MTLLLILIGIFALWSNFYTHNVKKNKLINNLKKYEQKKRKN